MRSVSAFLLLCVVLASTAYAQKLPGPNSASDVKALNGNDLKVPLDRPSQLKSKQTQNPSTKPPSASRGALEGATVTGSYIKIEFLLGNRFDPNNAQVPSEAGNAEGYIGVPIRDTWIEFATQWGSADSSDKLDITTDGLITLEVKYGGYPIYWAGEYTLESTAFSSFGGAVLVSSTLPAEVSAIVRGPSADVLTISIPTFDMGQSGEVNFKLQYQLVKCVAGKDAPCCDPATNTLLKGTICRNSTGDCDPARTCNGEDATCPVNPVADGTKCAYYPLDEIIDRFKPFNPKGWPAQVEVKKHGSSYDGHSRGHPPCTGKCNAGKCNLDKSHPGCCTLGPWKYLEAEEQKAIGKTAAAAEYKTKEGEVYCWEGTYSSKKDYGKVKP